MIPDPGTGASLFAWSARAWLGGASSGSRPGRDPPLFSSRTVRAPNARFSPTNVLTSTHARSWIKVYDVGRRTLSTARMFFEARTGDIEKGIPADYVLRGGNICWVTGPGASG